MAAEGDLPRSAWSRGVSFKYGKIAKLQDRFLTDQSRLKFERETVLSRLQNLRESMYRCSQLCAPNDTEISESPLQDSRKAAFEQFRIDEQAFEEQIRFVIEQEQSLGNVQYRLSELLPKLLGSIGSGISKGQVERKQGVSDDSSRSHPSSPLLDPRADKYYNKRGDVRLLRDRLFNHMSEFGRSANEQMGNTLASVEATNSTQLNDAPGLQDRESSLRDRWKDEHDVMENTLHEEERQLKRLWEACQDAGLDVEQLSRELPTRPQFFDASPPSEPEQDLIELNAPPFLRLDSAGIVPQFLRDINWPERGGFAPSSLLTLDNFAEKRDQIESWVGKIPETIFGPTRAPAQWTEFEHIVENSKHDSDWLAIHTNRQESSFQNDYSSRKQDEDTGVNEERFTQRPSQRALRRWRSDEVLSSRRSSVPADEQKLQYEGG